MHIRCPFVGLLTLCLCLAGCAAVDSAVEPVVYTADAGNRPLQLVAALPASALKTQLQACSIIESKRTGFSIAHRGAPLGYPEHTREGYIAAANMGAGAIECDVAFTSDGALVCRHSHCDLHRTTNILQTPLARQCSSPFTPARDGQPADATCCTTDITLAQFKTLCGRRDVVNADAQSVEDYLSDPGSVVMAEPLACATLLTHAESIELIDRLGASFIPELKSPQVAMPYQGMSQSDYASRMLVEYEQAGVDPARVAPQSFALSDVVYWLAHHPDFAANAVYLDPRGRQRDFVATLQDMLDLKAKGITTVAPPMPMLLTLDDAGQLQPSDYARFARQAGLNIVTWTFESGDASDPDNWLYANLAGYMDQESRMLEVLHALHTRVGIKGIFSDWPGTVTYYANCFGL